MDRICRNCGQPVPEDMMFCPTCGSRMADALGRVCVACGQLLQPGERICPTCGYPVDEMAEIPVMPVMTPIAPTEQRCAQCGAVIVPGNQFCMQCGAPAGAAAPMDHGRKCPRCGAINQSEDRFCISCGMTLDVNTGGGSTGVICDRCGTLNQPGDRFCICCGNPMGDAASAAAPAALAGMQICIRCGTVNQPGDRFCIGCGGPLGASAPSAPPKPARPAVRGSLGMDRPRNHTSETPAGKKTMAETEFHQAGDL